MTAPKRSLRAAIGKWLGSGVAGCFRLSRIGRSDESRWRCVRIDVDCPSGTLSLVFFRHDDGAWHVFPPGRRRAAIGGSRYAGQFLFDVHEPRKNLARV